MEKSNIKVFDICSYLPLIRIKNNSKERNPIDLETEIEFVEKGVIDSELQGKEKEILIKARVNQNKFRYQLLERYNKCCLCSIKNPILLIASHIKPWSESKVYEKLDVENGFLFCANHDKLFDAGWISFDNNGEIIISKEITKADRETFNINANMKIDLTEKNKKYLEYHREYIFEKKNK